MKEFFINKIVNFKSSKLFVLIFISLLFVNLFSFQPLAAKEESSSIFKARVIEVLSEVEKVGDDGVVFIQQDLLLEIFQGERKGEQVKYFGISEIEVISSNIYKKGNRVFIDSYLNENHEEVFYIVDSIRTKALLILFILFLVVVFLVARTKGLRALFSLLLSFLVIIKFILPRIIAGNDPFIISLIGGLVIMVFIIYLTEGWQRKSHLSILTVFVSLSITLVLSLIFVYLTNLSGLAQEEASFLIGVNDLRINFKGLLLAGFIIGAIGVLDDIIVGQIETVQSLREANPNLSSKEVFFLAYRVGNTHLGAIINTLFLTYTSVALPLLLLFVINDTKGLSIERFLSTEVVSTEVVRTLVGSIGVVLSMPIATFLGSFYGYKKKR